MKIEFRCKCGLLNQTKQDWLAHWNHGLPRSPNFGPKLTKHPAFLDTRPKLRAIYFFFLTEIRIVR